MEKNASSIAGTLKRHLHRANWCDDFGLRLQHDIEFHKVPRVLSLFSGAGGLDIGFFDAGFDIVEKVEIDAPCVKTLRANSQVQGYYGQEVLTTCLDIQNYKPTASDIDFIIGGPPCQSYSAAGARASGVAGTRDERGGLFREYVRLLKKLRPKGFLFENVYRIMGANQGQDWTAIVKEFSAAGYHLKHRILDTADYGVPQHRERLIIVGLRADLIDQVEYRFPRPTHGPDSKLGLPYYTAGQAVIGLDNSGVRNGLRGKYGHLLSEIPAGLNYSFFTEKMGHPNPIFAWRSKFSDFLYKADPNAPIRTLKAQGGQYTGPFHWDSRPFSINELKRLQSFPDRYTFVGSQLDQIKQIGNSVPPQFARILALSLAEQVFQSNLPFKLDYLEYSEVLGFRNRKRSLTKHYESVAKEALATKKMTACSKIATRSYQASLGSNFSWQVAGQIGAFKVQEKEKELPSGTLKIAVKTTKSKPQVTNKATIEIRPRQKWLLPFPLVALSIDHLSDSSFTAAWKSFENFLMHNSLKADLVQLAGYYQYDCEFQSKTQFQSSDKFYDFLSQITEGIGINQELSLESISQIF